MPPKKTRIAQRSRKAKIMKQKRREETPEQRDRRRAEHREAAARYRASETPEQLEARREFNRVRAAVIRAAETRKQREIRRKFHNERVAQIIASETPEQREVRRQYNRERVAAIRAAETAEEREARLRNLRERAAAKRRSKVRPSIPQDPERRKVWVRNIGRVNTGITKFSKVCSKHFTADSFDQSKFGGTWLKSTAVPTVFDNLTGSTSGIDNGEASTSYSGTGREYYLGEFEYEEKAAPEKTGGKKQAQQHQKQATQTAPAAETSVLSFEPEIVIKEEPIDIDENQLPSTSRAREEFILPEPDWTPAGHTPALGEAFSLVKMEKTPSKDKDGQSVKGVEDDSNKTKDHFDAYGEYIAAKLRKLDWKSCAYVQKAIGDIIFDAEMGKYK